MYFIYKHKVEYHYQGSQCAELQSEDRVERGYPSMRPKRTGQLSGLNTTGAWCPRRHRWTSVWEVKMKNANWPLKIKWTEKLCYFPSPMPHCFVSQCLTMPYQACKFKLSIFIFSHLRLRTKLLRKLIFLLTWSKMLYFFESQNQQSMTEETLCLVTSMKVFLQGKMHLIAEVWPQAPALSIHSPLFHTPICRKWFQCRKKGGCLLSQWTWFTRAISPKRP